MIKSTLKKIKANKKHGKIREMATVRLRSELQVFLKKDCDLWLNLQ